MQCVRLSSKLSHSAVAYPNYARNGKANFEQLFRFRIEVRISEDKYN